MNKSWLLLIVMGLVFLGAAIGWEAYQNFSGTRSNIDISVIEYQRSSLFSSKLEKHITTDTKYINQLSTQPPASSGITPLPSN